MSFEGEKGAGVKRKGKGKGKGKGRVQERNTHKFGLMPATSFLTL